MIIESLANQRFWAQDELLAVIELLQQRETFYLNEFDIKTLPLEILEDTLFDLTNRALQLAIEKGQPVSFHVRTDKEIINFNLFDFLHFRMAYPIEEISALPDNEIIEIERRLLAEYHMLSNNRYHRMLLSDERLLYTGLSSLSPSENLSVELISLVNDMIWPHIVSVFHQFLGAYLMFVSNLASYKEGRWLSDYVNIRDIAKREEIKVVVKFLIENIYRYIFVHFGGATQWREETEEVLFNPGMGMPIFLQRSNNPQETVGIWVSPTVVDLFKIKYTKIAPQFSDNFAAIVRDILDKYLAMYPKKVVPLYSEQWSQDLFEPHRHTNLLVDSVVIERISELNPNQSVSRSVQQILYESLFPGDITQYLPREIKSSGMVRDEEATIRPYIVLGQSIVDQALKKLAITKRTRTGLKQEKAVSLAKRLILEAVTNPPIGQVIDVKEGEEEFVKFNFLFDKQYRSELMERFPSFDNFSELARNIIIYKLKRAMMSNLPWLILFPAMQEQKYYEEMEGSMQFEDPVGVSLRIPEAFIEEIYDKNILTENMSLTLFLRRVLIHEFLFPFVKPDDIKPEKNVELKARFTQSQMDDIHLNLSYLGEDMSEILTNIIKLRIDELDKIKGKTKYKEKISDKALEAKRKIRYELAMGEEVWEERPESSGQEGDTEATEVKKVRQGHKGRYKPYKKRVKKGEQKDEG